MKKSRKFFKELVGLLFPLLIFCSCSDRGGGHVEPVVPLFASNDIFSEPPSSISTFSLADGTTIEAASEQIVLTFSEIATRTDYDNIASFLQNRNGNIVGQSPESRTIQIQVNGADETYVQNLITDLLQQPNVDFVFLNAILEEELTPNPATFAGDWWMDTIQIEKAWDITKGDSSIPIGIVDSGIDLNSGHFEGKNITILRDWVCSSWTDNASNGDGHGTAVASLLASRGDDGKYSAGIAWNNPILFADVSEPNCTFLGSSLLAKVFTFDTLAGIESAIKNGAKVINVSRGVLVKNCTNQAFIEGRKTFRQRLTPAVRLAKKKGALIVFSAGNDGNGSPSCSGIVTVNNDNQLLPDGFKQSDKDAWLSNTIIVAASDIFNNPTNFTRQGDVVDIAAPGESVTFAFANQTGVLDVANGTSLATPQVAGVAALIFGLNNNLTPTNVKNIITSNVTPSASGNIGGILNAYNAVLAVTGKIAFISNRDGLFEIYVMNANGTSQINLTNNPTHDTMPAWSPDGSKIAFKSNRDGNNEIYVMNADGNNQINLTNNSANEGDNGGPAWFPDGTKIAFPSYRDGNNEIYVMNADGSAQTNLTNNLANDSYPAWSPDGTKIAFESFRDDLDGICNTTSGTMDCNHEIYIMNANGTNQTRLTNNPADDNNPAWSPDGSKIAFQSLRDGNREIYVMNANGTNQTRLTNNPAWDLGPVWSTDGSKIVFYSFRDGNYEIYVMNANGTNQTRLTNNPAYDGGPDWSQ